MKNALALSVKKRLERSALVLVLSDKSGQVSNNNQRESLGREQLTPLDEGGVAKVLKSGSAF
ncbi:hypothetical protein NHF45_13395 [Maricaulaceae bacterium NA33B04]|nr:hypothetical protein [Maricaulaceae bacterium NA33B04]